MRHTSDYSSTNINTYEDGNMLSLLLSKDYLNYSNISRIRKTRDISMNKTFFKVYLYNNNVPIQPQETIEDKSSLIQDRIEDSEIHSLIDRGKLKELNLILFKKAEDDLEYILKVRNLN